VVVDGFYEWKKKERVRQPFLFRQEDGKPFALAGIWEHATTPDGEVVDCCAIITGQATGVVAPLHDRMPLVVPREAFERWLSKDARTDELLKLIAPVAGEGPRPTPGADASVLVAHPVSTVVNSPANDDPRCIEPAAEEEGSLPLF
jgi:putative SOS response-associated peptidase YedK